MRTLMALLLFTVVVGGPAFAQDVVKEGTQKTCPVMGEKIDPKVHEDVDGRRVYFCCKMCVKKFTADPAKYLRKMKESGEEPALLGKAQTTCPLTGEAISGKNFGTLHMARVDFCCAGCEKKFAEMKESEKQAVIDKLVAGGQAPTLLLAEQTVCPVMGGKIDKAAFADVNGDRTYFCCPGCKEKYVQNKAEYDKKMAEKGIAPEKAPAEKPAADGK